MTPLQDRNYHANYYVKVFAKAVKEECRLLKISPIFALVAQATDYSLLVTSAAVCTLRLETIALSPFSVKKKGDVSLPYLHRYKSPKPTTIKNKKTSANSS